MEIIDSEHIICPFCKLELIGEYGKCGHHKDHCMITCPRCSREIKLIVDRQIKYSTYIVGFEKED